MIIYRQLSLMIRNKTKNKKINSFFCHNFPQNKNKIKLNMNKLLIN